MSFHSRAKLDFPVSLGGYHHPRDPSEPMCLHLVHVPGAPNRGLDARTQFRIGQARLLDMTFADFEAKIRDELDRMLEGGGFTSARDIAAITVNRWPHGYGYVANSLYDEDDYASVLERAQRAENARMLTRDNEQLLHESGLFRFHQPKSFGGMQLPFVAVVDSADVHPWPGAWGTSPAITGFSDITSLRPSAKFGSLI